MKNSNNVKSTPPKALRDTKSPPKRTPKHSPSDQQHNQAYRGARTCKAQDSSTIEKQEENYLARCTNFRLTTGYELSICNCKHVRRMTLGERHSIVNPQRWLCEICLTTESVWACLSCPNVACGRYIQEHALTHYQESGHPLAIDVNELYVFCYKCDDYVLNDNNSSDIKVLRETLQAIRYQNFTGTTRSGHTLRSAMISEQEDLEMRRQMQQEQLDRDDRIFTAIWHSRFVRQRKAFRNWTKYIRWKRLRSKFPPDSSDEEDILSEVEPCIETADSDPPLMMSLSGEMITSSPPSHVEDSPYVPKQCILPTGLESSDLVSSLPGNRSTTEKLDYEEPLVTSDGMVIKPSTLAIDVTDIASVTSEFDSKVPMSLHEGTSKLPEDSSRQNRAGAESPLAIPDDPLKMEIKAATVPHIPIITKPLEINSKKEVRLVTVTLPCSSVLKHTKPFESMVEEKPLEINIQIEEDTKEEVKREVVKPTVLNILSRPKRSTAARRYKEIFGKLIASSESTREEWATSAKRPRLTIDETNKVKKPVGRRSDRLRKLNEEKEREINIRTRRKRGRKPKNVGSVVRGRPPLKNRKNFQKRDRSKNVRKKHNFKAKTQRARRLLVTERGLQSRKRLPLYQSQSLYDNIPNRAVTSLIPGVTGLRNLGNTCYLNSIIQVLGHLQKFRRCLLALRELEFMEALSVSAKDTIYVNRTGDGFLSSSPKAKAAQVITRRSTMELYEEQTRPGPLPVRSSDRLTKSKSGLNGGKSMQLPDSTAWCDMVPHSPPRRVSRRSSKSATGPDHWAPSLSLCNELDHLYRVMWSGKWKLVSPYHFLHSVWSLIPSFRGYTQQDAQEFLCELLDKIVSELERCHSLSSTENKLALRILKVVQKVFEGRLMSSVRCLECGKVSATVEPFWDLSLEFPERYHKVNSLKRRPSVGGKSSPPMPLDQCTLQEMLQNFTAPETLEGGKVYGCAKCNILHPPKSPGTTGKKRSAIRKNSQLLTEAEKQLKVLELPQVIRFHLKRFRWIGRNHREKITVHVDFPPELDMRDYCWDREDECGNSLQYMYDLSAVVIHHGRGFGSGHYTANCWNDIGEFWVHCNDSNLELRSIEDVMMSQAYILFYTQRGLDPHPHILSPPATPKTSPSPINSHFVPPQLEPDPHENKATAEEHFNIKTNNIET